MSRTEIIVNWVGTGTSGAAAADTLIQSSNAGTSQYELVNNAGQVVANVVGIFPFLAPIGMQINTLAGTMTFLKIVADLRDGKEINAGDVLNLVGNAAGIVASVTVVIGGSPSVLAVAGMVAIASGSAGIIGASGGLRDWTNQQIRTFWPQQPAQDLNSYWIDTEGRARRYDDILNDPNSGFKSIVWGSDDSYIEKKAEQPPPRRPNDEEVDGDGMI